MVCIKLSDNKGEDDSDDKKIISGEMSGKEKKNISEQKSKQEDLEKEKTSNKLPKEIVSKEILPQNNKTQENASQFKLPEDIVSQESAAQIKLPENIVAQDMISNDNSEQENQSRESSIQEITLLESMSQESSEQKKSSPVNPELDLKLKELERLDALNLQNALLNSLYTPQNSLREGIKLLREFSENINEEGSQYDTEDGFETALEDIGCSSVENSELLL
ncbi:hypothetical protein NBO_841g0001 [Nosema bombycis CQ1]|uniref:Uncharacterized protein n=1 Tax=Nosema bombycis (strain CQ1 / CVCC 102059) TaxID=578461 RepID=R0MCL7_NOSB1|nr:hypothetical protein NBO_841g0001 [Nosema bombycis CQ1]|eukprot:EOB11785.1 hypothetical protein NBO_841g0001 [Nosema bombycis CQ1]